mgnify:CR=1 FL=1
MSTYITLTGSNHIDQTNPPHKVVPCINTVAMRLIELPIFADEKIERMLNIGAAGFYTIYLYAVMGGLLRQDYMFVVTCPIEGARKICSHCRLALVDLV